MRVDDLVLLERLKLAVGGVGALALLVVTGVVAQFLATTVVDCGGVSFNELNTVGVNNAVILRLDAEIISDKFDRTFVGRRDSGLTRAAEAAAATAVSASTAAMMPVMALSMMSLVTSMAASAMLIVVVVVVALPMHLYY